MNSLSGHFDGTYMCLQCEFRCLVPPVDMCGYPCDMLVYWSPFSSVTLAESLNNLPEGQRMREPENEELARNWHSGYSRTLTVMYTKWQQLKPLDAHFDPQQICEYHLSI